MRRGMVLLLPVLLLGQALAQLPIVAAATGGVTVTVGPVSVAVNDATTGGVYPGFNGDATNPNPQNLTAAGATDWRIFGRTTTALAGDDRKSGGAGISDLTDINPAPSIGLRALGPLGLIIDKGPSSMPFGFSWSDGTSNASGSSVKAGLQHNAPEAGSVGKGFSLSVPAAAQKQRLTLWVSAHHGTGRLSVSGLTAEPVDDVTVHGGQNHGGVYTIEYTGSGEPGQTLTVSYVLDSLEGLPSDNDSDGLPITEANVVVYAAALAPVGATPDFTIGPAAPANQVVAPGTNATSTVPFAPLNGASGPLGITAAVTPPSGGVTATVAAGPHAFGDGSTTVQVAAASEATPGPYVVTVTGTLGAITHQTVINVTVPTPAEIGAPVLTGIYHVGADTYYAGRLTATPSTLYHIALAAGSTCPTGSGGPAPFATIDATTTANGSVFFSGKLLGKVPNGPLVAARITGPGVVSSFSSCVADGPDNDTWPRAFLVNLDGPSTAEVGTSTGYIDLPGRERWFKFHVQPGARVTIGLTDLPADYDLVLFKDVKKTYDALTTPSSTDDLNRLGAEYAASGFTASGFTASGFTASGFTASGFTDSVYSASGFTASGFTASGFTASGFTASGFTDDAFSASGFTASGFTASGFTASGFTASGFTGDPFAGAQTRSLVAISASTGAGDEIVAANTWTNTGDYYIRVSGKNGVASLDAPFHVTITQDGGLCDGVGPSTVASDTTIAQNGYKTVILTDSNRLPTTSAATAAAERTALQTKLATFAARPEVKGVIVDLKDDDRVADLNSKADTHPACVYAKNLVADAIRDLVRGFRDTSGSPQNPNAIAYVVVVGGDDVIPFFRYPDNSDLGPESAFVPPVKSDSAAEASLRNNYVLSQDAYGAGSQISLYSSTFPIPDLPVGRLVETAPEVSGMLDAYTATNGVVTPQNALVTGYDFLFDAADKAKTDLAASTTQPIDTLIAPFNAAPTDPISWNATALKTKFLGSRHGITFLAGHFSASSALAADFSTSMTTADLVNSPTDLSNTVVLSLGCHSGYNIGDAVAVPNVTQPLDWPQAFARKKITGILGTGYQYGDTEFIEYSERIYTDVTHRLRYGAGPVSLGSALVDAKLAYLTATPDIRGLHEKALREATLYGLPMLGVNLPSGRGLSDPTDATIGAATGVATGPGASLGLKTATLTVHPTLTATPPVTLQVLGGGAPLSASYLKGLNGVVSNPGEPAIPLDVIGVGLDGYVLRGVGLVAGHHRADESVVPLTGAPATELKTAHTPFTSSTFFPSKLWTANYYDAISQGGAGTKLLVTPVQHRAINPGDPAVTRRAYDQLELKLYYSKNTVPGSGSDAPALSDISASVSGAAVTFKARAVGDPRAGIQDVWVTWKTGDTWNSEPLSQDSTDSSLWTKTVSIPVGSVTQLDYIVQAVNGFGLVTMNDNAGAYHHAFLGATAAPQSTSLALAGTPDHGTYGSSATISATLSGPGPVGSRQIVFTLGAATRSATTDSGGHATVSMPLTSTPNDYLLTAKFAGDAASSASGDARSFEILETGTTLTLSPSTTATTPKQVVLGADSGITATLTDGTGTPLGYRTVYFVLSGAAARTTTATTDFLGRASLGTLPAAVGAYTVTACFNGPASPAACAALAIPDGTYGASGATGYVQQIWPWTGFFQPVDNQPTINSAKAGSTVPVKFSLGGNRGLDILEAGYPKVVGGSCAAGATIDEIETTTTNSGLAYDTVTGQYQYNWKTTKGVTGCYRLDLKLKDGTTRSASFQLK